MKKYTILLLALLFAVMPLAAQETDDQGLVNAGGDETLTYLVDSAGMTLYIFTNDEPGVSNCAGQCLENWPPLLVNSIDEITAGAGVNDIRLGWIENEDGTFHVTYDDMPLYYFIGDEAPGDTNGQGVNDVWFIVEVLPFTLDIGFSPDLGSYITDGEGMTLYIFTNDEPGVSNCTGQCLENWPPLTVESADEITVNPYLLGEVDVIEREDTGELQVTYNGYPLYYFITDVEAGDTTGQGVGDVWFIYPPEIIGVGGNDELGNFLVGPDGYTLYVFANDEPGVSNCAGQCLENWPPLLAFDVDTLIGTPQLDSSRLGSIPFAEDDTLVMVTWDGYPLYYFIGDEAPGDANGHEVNNVWFIVPVDMDAE
ncbi:MAG: hypothetical protein CUN56_13870 [Phototrophicales bacterium]|nr:MAG: hypothetical protein CUN56_13870 [Phototrophicales bacterium]RMG73162.1 MAG: hypothetical protein D6711_11440 [Chloroflexota bacterium]